MSFIKAFFRKEYFIVFSTDQSKYCWRVVNKKIFTSLPELIDALAKSLEEQGKTNVALIKIKRV
ncbi:MAG: hypothetical protein ACRC6O_13365 [Flavobacterium sp.]